MSSKGSRTAARLRRQPPQAHQRGRRARCRQPRRSTRLRLSRSHPSSTTKPPRPERRWRRSPQRSVAAQVRMTQEQRSLRHRAHPRRGRPSNSRKGKMCVWPDCWTTPLMPPAAPQRAARATKVARMKRRQLPHSSVPGSAVPHRTQRRTQRTPPHQRVGETRLPQSQSRTAPRCRRPARARHSSAPRGQQARDVARPRRPTSRPTLANRCERMRSLPV